MMRLGLMLSGARSAAEAMSLARRAEQVGIEDIWVSEDYFERGAFVVASAVAVATRSARVGVGVVNPWTRHPMLTAMEFAALDEVADGRAVLGLGTSNKVWMHDRCGIAFQAPLSAVDESVHIIRAALAGRQVTVSGRHFSVDAALSFEPRRPSPPIYLGAKGRRALELTGRIADGVLLSLLTSADYVSWARDRSGPTRDTAAYVLVSCAADRAAARARVRRPLAFYLGVHGDHDITRVAGLDPDLAARFRTGWLTGRPAEDLVDEAMIDTFAVAGDVDDCLAGLDRLGGAGLDSAVLRDPGDDGVEGVLGLAAAYVDTVRATR